MLKPRAASPSANPARIDSTGNPGMLPRIRVAVVVTFIIDVETLVGRVCVNVVSVVVVVVVGVIVRVVVVVDVVLPVAAAVVEVVPVVVVVDVVDVEPVIVVVEN